jgi:hypothetical protein
VHDGPEHRASRLRYKSHFRSSRIIVPAGNVKRPLPNANANAQQRPERN